MVTAMDGAEVWSMKTVDGGGLAMVKVLEDWLFGGGKKVVERIDTWRRAGEERVVESNERELSMTRSSAAEDLPRSFILHSDDVQSSLHSI